MQTAEYYIEQLNMEPHIEGGYFKECLLSDDTMESGIGESKAILPGRLQGRNLWSSIYFLLQENEVSNFHVLESDEVWYFHDGEPLTIYMISPEGVLSAPKLGLHIEKGEQPQLVVPKGYIFGAAKEGAGYSLVGCMVAPCFQYEEFYLSSREELLKKYPQYEDVILRLTRP